ncbi:MAG: type II secretion system F family protein [Coriobacteriales bacterium]|nr:type II secretion system F family protein [Coriobacteriales bacterium]
MVTYKYTAISKSGQKVSGVIEGFNEFDAAEKVRESCDIVIKLTPVKDKSDDTSFLNMEIGGNKLDMKAFMLMCNQFSIILRAGVPISRTVELISQKTTNKPLRKMLRQVAEDVEAGRSLSASFAERGGKLLPATFIETIHAGEESGNLDSAFESMSKHYEKRTKMEAKVRGAMIYPTFVLIIAVAVVIVLMVKVVPTFTEVFKELGAELPLPTRMLIAISNFFRRYSLIIFIIIAVIFIAIKLYGNTEKGRMNLAKLQRKLPVMGNITELNAASQYSNTMAMMLAAGLPLPRAVSITANVMDNYYVSQSIGGITANLESGHTLGDSLREVDCLPDILVDMNAVGEETGELEHTLSTIGEFYDAELEQATADALAKLEPATLIVLAVIAGFIVIAMYMAMFSMYNSM